MNQYRENTIRSRFGNGQINTAKYRQIVYERPWDHWPENSEQIISFVKNLPEVTHVFPRIEFFALLTSGKKTISGKGQGVDGVAESDFFTALNVDQGKNLTNESDGIILGQGLANALDVKVGDNLTVLANTIYGSFNGIDVVVTGIFQTGAKEFDDSVFRVPITQAQLLLDTNKVESIAVGLQSVQLWPQFAQKVKKNFPNLDLTPFEILDKVYYQNSVDFLQS